MATTNAINSGGAASSSFNINPYRTRLGYLQKTRPKDKEVQSLQRMVNIYDNTGPVDAARAQQRIDFLKKVRPKDAEIGLWQYKLNSANNSQAAPAPTQSAPVASAEPAPAQPAPQDPASVGNFDFNSYQSPMTKALLEAMGKGMNTMQAYEPQNFEGSPLYQFQKTKGLADLEKLMASRGLTGSGAEIQGNSDFLAQLNATEAEKQRQYAEANRDRQLSAMQFIANFDKLERDSLRDQWNKDLDQRTNIQQFEATRDDAKQAQALQFLQSILGLMGQNDISRLSASGLNSQTDLTKALINAQTNATMASAPVRSGGGAGPAPQQSNTSGLYEILSRYGNRAGNNDLINGLLSFFK